MEKKFTVAILGAGGRGYVYANLFKKQENFEVVSVCDYNPAQLEKINVVLNLPEEAFFREEDEFFKERRADVVVVATRDRDHVRQCIKAMKQGCDVLLEKPVSDSKEELEEILKVQRETGRIVVVCHVMRYAAGILKLDELLASGVIGKLLAIDQTERVEYWHQAMAYVRIQKLYHDTQHPTILAKCCHDLDVVQHFAGARCESVSSVGALAHFRRENMPAGAAKRCIECPHMETCTYSAKKLYIDLWKERGCPTFSWPWNKVSLVDPNTEEDLYEGLKTSILGECAFQCDVENNPHVVDHQMVQMWFQNGVIASLKMIIAAQSGRRTVLSGTEGEIVLEELTDSIEVKPYGKKIEVIKLSELNINGGHGGGDAKMVDDLYDILTGAKTVYTSLEESVESHLIGICAEESRLDGGKMVKVH